MMRRQMTIYLSAAFGAMVQIRSIDSFFVSTRELIIAGFWERRINQ